MHWRTLPVLLGLMAAGPVLADTPLSVPLAGNALCRKAIAAAERAHGIPPHLLAAIARVESGRRDPIAGTFDPWPWTINMDGQGTFYDNKTRAMAAAVAIQPRAERSIDVGCMQISLTYHPDAFTDMAQAFDPASNAEYGARFLMQLFEKTNAWPKAVALYHSGTADLGDAYQRRVYAAWPEEQKLADGTTLYPMTTGGAFGVKRSLLAAPLRQGPPHVIPLVPGLDGGAPAGRSLQAYRLAPVRMASRAP